MGNYKLLQAYYFQSTNDCNRHCIYCKKNNHIPCGKNVFDAYNTFLNYYKENHKLYDFSDLTISSCDGGFKSQEIFIKLMNDVKNIESYDKSNTAFRFLSTTEYLTEDFFKNIHDEIFILSIDGDFDTMKKNRHVTKKEWSNIFNCINWCDKYNIKLLTSVTFYPHRDYFHDLVFIYNILKKDLTNIRWQPAFEDGAWTYDEVNRLVNDFKKFYMDIYLKDHKHEENDFLNKIRLRHSRYCCISKYVIGNKNDSFGTCLKTTDMNVEYKSFVYKLFNDRIKYCNNCFCKDLCLICLYDLISMCYTSKEIYCYMTKKFYEASMNIDMNILKG